MVEGVIQYCDSAGLALHTLRPDTKTQARSLVEKWVSETAGRTSRSLLVLAGSDYESIASNVPALDGDNRTILLVESERSAMPKGVVTANVDRRGVMYLAGAMSSRTPAYILAAMRGNEVADIAIQAFRDGYEAHDQGYRIEEVKYLSSDEKGYAMPNAGYEYTAGITDYYWDLGKKTGSDYKSRFILLPMAGSTNTGVYFYMMQSFSANKTFNAVIGMDVDYNDRLAMAPFSVVIKVNLMLRDCISGWLEGAVLPAHRTYSFGEGYADVLINSSFDGNSVYAMEQHEFDDGEGGFVYSYDFLPEDYWSSRYEELKDEAEKYAEK
ncbi:MAG: hypothetical protein HUJ94_08385 [Bacteroidales bacterium]|nr:hypothetical protein [Bacteroidales bacterium]